jgi:acyl-CoA thioesterase YciA
MAELEKPYIALQVVMMPKDANGHPSFGMLPGGGQYALYSTIFGGVLLSYLDLAGAITAQRELQLRKGNPKASFVTVAINRVEFKKPVFVGDVVRFETTIVRIGRTSITVRIDVHAERGAETIHVTEAEGVFVGVDLSTPDRKPVPLFPEGETT